MTPPPEGSVVVPDDVKLIRAWAGHPLCMLQELDETFDAVMMVGYHAAAGSEANSLAHTLSSDAILIKLNGKPASEFLVHALASSMLGVPTVFVTGDKGLMDEVQHTNPAIGRCAVTEGRVIVAKPDAQRLVDYLLSMNRNYPRGDMRSGRIH